MKIQVSRAERIAANTLFFAFAYVLSAYSYMLLTATVCWVLGYKPIPTYNELLNLNKDFDYWSKLRVVVVFGSAPISMLIISLVLFGVSRIRYNVRPLRFFLFWLSLAYVNFFLTNLVIIPSYHVSYYWGAFQGFSTIAAWFYLPLVLGVVFSIIGLLMAMALGFFVRKRFFRYYFPISQDDELAVSIHRSYFNEMFWLPFAFAVVPLLLLTNDYSISLHVCYLLVWIFFGIGLSIQKQNHFLLDGDRDHNVYQHIFNRKSSE